MTPQPDPLADRVERLEEALLFAQRDADHLRDELVVARKELTELRRKVRGLERRLAGLNDPEGAAALERPDVPDRDD